MFKLEHLILFVGPSGVGKGEIYKRIKASDHFKDRIKLSCSATTRLPRLGEINGIHYHFITKQQFEKLISDNLLVEYNLHFNNYYGTLLSELEEIAVKGLVPFVEIETIGAKQIINYFKVRGRPDIITSFFIAPPSIKELEERLRKRNSEDNEGIKLRLEKAKEELGSMSDFEHVIVNRDVDTAVDEIITILKQRIKISDTKKL